MNTRFALKIAVPMVVLGVLLLLLGAFAAWNVHEQHQTSSETIAREVRGVIAVGQFEMLMREIRYQINIFLRTRDRQRLRQLDGLTARAFAMMAHVEEALAHSEYDLEVIRRVDADVATLFREFEALAGPRVIGREGTTVGGDELPSATYDALARLTDEEITRRILEPLRQLVEHDDEVVRTTNEANRATARHLRVGFLLLGICGGGAGLLMGMGIARAVWRSIVQLDVSVRTAVDKLADVTGPVTFSHTGDIEGLDTSLRGLENHIAEIVERLNQRETELLRSEQLARVGQLAAGLAHELRNPLMPMKVLVQAALEKGNDAGLKGRSLQIIDEEISRLERSIQTFLDFARPPVVEKAPADLRELVLQTLELTGGRADQKFVTIRADLPDEPVIANVDRSQIRQLLLNLILNALDALEEGGAIEVTLDPRAPAPEWDEPEAPDGAGASIASEHDALRLLAEHRSPWRRHGPRWLSIAVADNGAGIPPEQLDQIFVPFFSSKETGTGLGLSICQRIAAAHDGLLTATNRPGGGAKLVLSIPRET